VDGSKWVTSSRVLRGEVLALVSCVGFSALAVAQNSGADIARLVADAQKEPRNAVLSERVGVAYVQREDLAHAREWFEKALAADPSRVSARKNLATILWFEGQHDLAEEMFSEVVKRVPADPVPHLYLGLAGYGRGEFPAAAAHFRSAGDLASANPEVMPTVAETYLQAGKYSDAAALVEKMIGAGTRTAPVYVMLGQAYDGLNRSAQAFDAFKTAVVLDSSEESALALARFSMQHGNTSYAREVLATGMASHPQSAKLIFEDGIASALEGNFDNALKLFDAAEQKSPDWAAPVLAQGLALLQQGKPEQAAGLFRRAAKMAPRDSRAHLLLAMALLRAGAKTDAEKSAEATAAARRAIELEPRSGRAHAVLGEILQAENQPGASLRELEMASRLDPGNATALYQLSQAYRREGRNADAHRALLAFEQAKAKTKAEQNELVEILVKTH
jgi:tetratricopeptide (TPR) repeat protein